MPGEEEWRSLLNGAAPPMSVDAETFLQAWGTWSRPVAVRCSDGNIYVVKGLQPTRPEMGRALVAEHVVGRLGRTLGAPIPHVVLVNIPAQLIAIEPSIAHLSPGLAHGSLLVANCSDRLGIVPPTTDRNRRAYATLAVLYGWAQANDHQLVSRLDAAGDFFSVDHGLFFPGAPNWDTSSLASAPPPSLDGQFMPHVLRADLASVLERLRTISDEVVAEFVAGPPAAWGVTEDERVALADYLSRRRDTLIVALEGMV